MKYNYLQKVTSSELCNIRNKPFVWVQKIQTI